MRQNWIHGRVPVAAGKCSEKCNASREYLIFNGVLVDDMERNGLTAGGGGAVGTVVVVVGFVVGLNVAFDEVR